MRQYRGGLIYLTALVMGLVLTGRAAARVEVEAIPGQPFGVGRITASLLGDTSTAAAAGGFALEEADGRALYPVFTTGRLRRLIGSLLGEKDALAPGTVTAYFLFTGDAPLRLTLYTPDANVGVVTPRWENGREYERLLSRWWREYNSAAREQQKTGDYPPLVQTYLTSMLSRRMGLRPTLIERVREEEKSDEAQRTLKLLLGLESLRIETLKDTALGLERPQAADLGLPEAPRWRDLGLPGLDGDVEIEPIASHVPPECFYIRFGRFNNYLWLNHLLEDYGGDIGSMVTLRGLNRRQNERVQAQLGLKQTVLAELLGETAIADVALIGRDTFMGEGAAMGILFQARNTQVLGRDLQQQRQEAFQRQRDNGATMETVQIAGRDVSFASTPDNRLRSFYVVDGDYHLVTTSRAVAESFLEVAAGAQSLGQTAEFRYARSIMPVQRGDTVFVYFSSAFFQGLVGPQYQIEMHRRLRASTDIELVQMARLAARQEGKPDESIETLVRAELLPDGFLQRADGSRPVMQDEQVIDSLRGARGTFLPVPDVPLRGVTGREAEAYRERASYYQENWRQMDPVMVGVRREVLNKEGRERVTVDAHVSPLDEKKYGWLGSMLAPPNRQQLAPVPGDVISAQAVLSGTPLNPNSGPHHVFLGVQDSSPPADLRPQGLLRTLAVLQSVPAYLGSWPRLGVLDMLPLGLAGPPDRFGFSALPLGLWRLEWQQFSLLSFDRRLLDHVATQVQFVDVEQPAQARVHIGDLSTARLAGWVRALSYDRAREASVGNARLLHTLSQQLGVPRDEAQATAERLLNAELVCTLGGTYELSQQTSGLQLWQSTAWPESGDFGIPKDYRTPLLEWFRGLDSDLTKLEDRLIVHTTLEMQRKPSDSKFQLPLFNFFGGQKKPTPEADKPEEVKPGTPRRGREL